LIASCASVLQVAEQAVAFGWRCDSRWLYIERRERQSPREIATMLIAVINSIML